MTTLHVQFESLRLVDKRWVVYIYCVGASLIETDRMEWNGDRYLIFTFHFLFDFIYPYLYIPFVLSGCIFLSHDVHVIRMNSFFHQLRVPVQAFLFIPLCF